MAERVSQAELVVGYQNGDAKERVSQTVLIVGYQSALERVSQTVLIVAAPLADWSTTPTGTGRSFAVIIG